MVRNVVTPAMVSRRQSVGTVTTRPPGRNHREHREHREQNGIRLCARRPIPWAYQSSVLSVFSLVRLRVASSLYEGAAGACRPSSAGPPHEVPPCHHGGATSVSGSDRATGFASPLARGSNSLLCVLCGEASGSTRAKRVLCRPLPRCP